MKISPAALRQAQALVASRLGLHFSSTRMADMERGLAHALRDSAYASLEPYLAWLAEVPDEDPELRRLAAQLTIGETHFFRDGPAFEALERHVLASLIATRRGEGVPRLRLWSAACATGEEPYSLAIQLDRLLGDRAGWSVTILATDINTEALEVAKRGLYRDWSFRGTPAWVRERYFHRQRDQTFELDPRIRGMVTFAPLNLAADGYPSIVTNTGAMDLVFCRNVLMYFTADAQRAAVARLQRSLVMGGWLLVGPAEASVELLRPSSRSTTPTSPSTGRTRGQPWLRRWRYAPKSTSHRRQRRLHRPPLSRRMAPRPRRRGTISRALVPWPIRGAWTKPCGSARPLAPGTASTRSPTCSWPRSVKKGVRYRRPSKRCAAPSISRPTPPRRTSFSAASSCVKGGGGGHGEASRRSSPFWIRARGTRWSPGATA